MQELLVLAAAYKFVEIDDPKLLQLKLLKICKKNKLLGTILIAHEGVNINIVGTEADINNFYNDIKSIYCLVDLNFKECFVDTYPFAKLKIKIKSEIIKFNINDLNVKKAGVKLNACEWENLIDQGALIIDTRNDYEVAFGTFKDAINPQIRNFTSLAAWIDENLKSVNLDKPIGMFCTGGIRCEKSTAYLIGKGFKNVYHLKNGIIEYIKESKSKQIYWQGECFVFDDRIAVDKDMKPCY